MSLPSEADARNRIDSCDLTPVKTLFQTVELFGLRIGEGCGYVYPSEQDKAQPTGMLLWASQETWQPREDDDEEIILLKRLMMRNYGKELSDMEVLKLQEPAFVLSIVTEKREGFNRKAAIPLNPEYEPWAKEVMQYIMERQIKGPLPELKKLTAELCNGKPVGILEAMKTKDGQSILENYEPIFPFKRQEVYPIAAQLFKGFTYPITQYNKRKVDADGEYVYHMKDGKKIYEYALVPEHQKRFSDHALRHLRSTVLKSSYHIRGEPLDKFMGWSKPRGGESSAMQDRYVLEPWKEAGYFPRLLRRRIA